MKFRSSKGGPLDIQKSKKNEKKCQEVKLPIVDAEFDAESIPHSHFARKNQFHAERVGSKNPGASLHVAGEPHFLSSLHERPGAVRHYTLYRGSYNV